MCVFDIYVFNIFPKYFLYTRFLNSFFILSLDTLCESTWTSPHALSYQISKCLCGTIIRQGSPVTVGIAHVNS